MSFMRGVIWIALGSLAAGCAGFLDGANAMTATVVWRQDGFFVEDKRREFDFDATANSETLTFDGQIVYTDLDRDGKVDRYEKRLGGKVRGKWTRAEPGTEELFTEADADFADARAMLGVDDRHETWSNMSQAARAKGHGFGARER